MPGKSVQRSVTISQEMHDRLALLISKQPRDTSESELIREAIRQYLDHQEDLAGSRRHFQKSLQDRLDQLESAFTFHLNIVIYLLTSLEPERSAERIKEAVISARRDGETLLAQIKAVREMKAPKR